MNHVFLDVWRQIEASGIAKFFLLLLFVCFLFFSMFVSCTSVYIWLIALFSGSGESIENTMEAFKQWVITDLRSGHILSLYLATSYNRTLLSVLLPPLHQSQPPILHYSCHSNSLFSLSAMEAGTEMLELDCHLTRDGHVIVSHDENLLRQTGVDINVSDLELEVRG